MNERRATKRALLTSITALVMCVVMLAGTTFAWFTDTASTNVNKIQAGKLDVALEMYDTTQSRWVNAEGKTLNWVKATTGSGQATLWEPGAEYKLPELKVVNNGNLALKYEIAITGAVDADGNDNLDSMKLLNVLKFKSVVGSTTEENAYGKTIATGTLYTKDAEQIIQLSAKMDENAGNGYMNMALSNITVTVKATQASYEYDSNGYQYDKDAQYPITSFADLKAAVEWNGKYNVTEDLDPDASLIIKNAVVTLNATGKTIANTQNIYNEETFDWSMISVRGWMGNLTITGGTFAAKANDCYVMDVRDGGYLTIEDGKFNGNVDAIYVEKGTAIIEGGFFDIQQKLTGNTPEAQYKTLLNCNDANYNAGRAKIIVKGGTFVNFDPSNNPEGEGTSFVADGYKVVSETQTNGDVWYTVVPL